MNRLFQIDPFYKTTCLSIYIAVVWGILGCSTSNDYIPLCQRQYGTLATDFRELSFRRMSFRGGLNTRVLEAKAYNHNCTQILSLRIVGIQVQTERQNLTPSPLLYQEERTQVTYFYDPAPEETFWIELNDWGSQQMRGRIHGRFILRRPSIAPEKLPDTLTFDRVAFTALSEDQIPKPIIID